MKKLFIVMMLVAMAVGACGKKQDPAAPKPPAGDPAKPADGTTPPPADGTTPPPADGEAPK